MPSAPNVQIRQFSCLSDNFGFLLHDPDSGKTIAIDVPDAGPYLTVLEETGWKLTDILITHHHWDHVQGLAELKTATGARVTGPERSRLKIEGMDAFVEDGDHVLTGAVRVQAISTPGHTLDQISWYFPELKVAHTGDTLFSLGCGRVFEGDMEMMWASLSKLTAKLPEDTAIFCGHEYTAANARFALTIDPDNEDLAERVKEVEALRAEGKPTLPTTLAEELLTNPFLRPGDAGIRKRLGLEEATDAEVFAEIRKRKDNA